MLKRITVKGSLNVYRESSQHERLSATLTVGKEVYYYHPCPKCYSDLIVDGQDNLKQIQVTMNLNGSNPRQAMLL